MKNLTSELVEEFREIAKETTLHKEENWATKDEKDIEAFMLTAFDRVRAEGRQGIVNAIKKELASVVVFDRRQITGGLYTDEPMRGPNVETLTFIKREDVEVILKAASGDIAS